MAAIKLEMFQGLIPRSSDRLLPPMAATEAKNAKLLNGEIRGYRALREEADFTGGSVNPVRRAFRVRDLAGVNADTWLTFDSRDVDVVRSPLVNDSFDRYYWAGDGVPKMNTYARIFAGSPGLRLGVPTPGAAPSVTPPVGTDETRAYVYTFVSAYGEEGAPSPPVVATGNAGTWALSGIQTTVDNPTERNITHVNIYRTVSGGNSSNFYFVAQITLGTATYNDNEATATVAANSLLESTNYAEPPSDLEGLVVMPNGYLVGWAGRRLVFSEPYRPHAWPPEYELSTEFPIVGLAVWGSTLVIGTQSQPYFGQGNTPAAFTTRKLDAVEPCLSRRGLVATVAGAYYPSINGLVLLDSTGAKVITQDVLTKEEWEAYSPSNIYAAQLGLQYIAFNTPSTGFLFNPTEQTIKLIELEGFNQIEGIETDKYSGNVLLLGQNRAWDWDPNGAERLNWRWQSKVYQTPEGVNFGAARLMFKTGGEDVSGDISTYYGPYNESLFTAVSNGNGLPVAGDDYWNNVRFMATFEGADGATTYTELSPNAEAGTFNGTQIALETTNPIIGSSSLESSQQSGAYVSFAVDDVNDWAYDGAYCTMEVMFELDSLPVAFSDRGIIHVGDPDNNIARVTVEHSSGPTYYVRAGFANGGGLIGPVTIATGTKYFLAVEGDYTGGAGNGVERVWFGELGSGTATLLETNTGLTAKSPVGMTQFIRVGDDYGASSEFDGRIDMARITVGQSGARYGTASSITIPLGYPVVQSTAGLSERGLNTLNGHALGGKPAQADGLVSGWTEPENRQPLAGSLIYPENVLNSQTLAVRLQVKVGEDADIVFDKVIYNDQIFRLPTGFKSDLWQFNLTGNTDVYSLQVGTTPRALKQV